MRENLKQWRKKKAFKIGLGVVGMLIIILIAGIVIYGKNSESSKSETSIQSAEVQTGNISTTVVGTGTLESAQTTDVVVPVGVKVEKVLVENGEEVSKGQKLATVNEASVAEKLLEVNENIDDVEDEIDNLSSDANVTGTTENLESKVLNGQLEELKEAQDKLEKLLDKKVITASCAGTISSIYVSADTEVERITESAGSTTEGSSSSNISASAATLTEESIDEVFTKVSVGVEEAEESKILFLNTDSAESGSDTGTGAVMIKECNIDITAPVAGNKPQTELSPSEYFTGTISWNCSTDTFLEDTVYIATLKLTAKEGYVFSKNIMPEVKGADVTSEVLEGDNGDSILKIKAHFAKTAKVSGTSASGDTNSKQSSESDSKSTNNTSQNNVNSSTGNSAESSSKASGGSVVANASAGGGGGSSSGSSQGTSGNSSSSEDYSIYETAAFSIASQDKIAVSINVDEMDILSVKEGQSATITLDALEDEQFEGEITNVSFVASTSSSSVKYPVKIVLEKTENMLLGMSASATICVEEVENALWIPVNALQERGNHTFVYTEKDSDGNLSGEVEVETGLSNESQVEITSGLEEGDTVYYVKTGSTENETDWMGGLGNGMPGGNFQKGTMPSGESKPAGGGNRQGGQKSGNES